MKAPFVLLHLTGEIAFLGGLILQYYTFLTPSPWRGQMGDSSVYFVPYIQPQGCEPPNPYSSAGFSNSTVHAVQIPSARRTMRVEGLAKREGDGSQPEVPKNAVWLGPLGSCNRDADGRVFCTKSSYPNTQYNLTHIQANSVYWPARMSSVIPSRKMIAVVILNSLGYIVFFIGSFPFWFPATCRRILGTMNNRSASDVAVVSAICLGASVDNFCLPAQCGTVRQLKPGLLLKAVRGNAYEHIWIGWVLIFLYAGPSLLYRASYIKINFNNLADNAAMASSRKEETKASKARAKEERKFKKEVEKEKIRLTALQELEKGKTVREGEGPPPQYVGANKAV